MFSKQNLRISKRFAPSTMSNNPSTTLVKSNIFASRIANAGSSTKTSKPTLKRKASAGTTTTPKQQSFQRKSMKPSIYGSFKANVEQDSKSYNSQLDELQPAIKALAHKYPWKRMGHAHHQKVVAAMSKIREKDVDLPPSEIPNAEKLITIGGYIISLQPTRSDLTTVLKPRISTDKDGIELEIKITGCHPSEIKFEKRYDTLIVIGVVNNPMPKAPIGLKSTYHGEAVSSEGREFMKSAGFLLSKVHTDQMDSRLLGINSLASYKEPLDEIHEVVNIFVPKSITLHQVQLSKPDSKGRVFVKGP